MQVSIESSTGLERQLKIGVPADRIEKEVTERLQKATKTVSIAGFRKGKVPLSVVKQSMAKVFARKLSAKLSTQAFTRQSSRKSFSLLVSRASMMSPMSKARILNTSQFLKSILKFPWPSWRKPPLLVR